MTLKSRPIGTVSGRNWHAVYKMDDGTEWVTPWPVVAFVIVEIECANGDSMIDAIALDAAEDGEIVNANETDNFRGLRWVEDGQKVYVDHESPTIDLANRGQRCTATTKAGTPCKNYAVSYTDPPRCAPHGGTIRSRR